MKSRPYVVLDVFTQTPFQGNPLAVVLDGEGLDTPMMQKIAGEFNLSETVFIFPPEDAANQAAVRIFTPSAELPFAGHPTVGTAVLLAKRALGEVDKPTDMAIALEERVGLVKTGVVAHAGLTGHATFTLPEKPVKVADANTDSVIAEALGLDVTDIGFDAHRPGVFSGGVPFTLVPISSVEAVQRLTPNSAVWERAFETAERDNAFVYARGGASENATFHARMFWPKAGIVEDPATGSAVAALVGAIVKYDELQDGSHTLLIEQGYEMGRASDITLEIDIEDGEFLAARISGSAVIVAEGTLYT